MERRALDPAAGLEPGPCVVHAGLRSLGFAAYRAGDGNSEGGERGGKPQHHQES